MTYYFDVTARANADMPTMALINSAFAKLHLGLVTLGTTNVGVSFPKAGKTPGDTLRVHGPQPALVALLALKPWAGMLDFVSLSESKPAPNTDVFVQVRRVQPKQTAAKIRRLIKRGSLTEDQGQALLEKQAALKQPFLRLTSASTGQKFPLFVEQVPAPLSVQEDAFNTYGLSNTASVPFFS